MCDRVSCGRKRLYIPSLASLCHSPVPLMMNSNTKALGGACICDVITPSEEACQLGKYLVPANLSRSTEGAQIEACRYYKHFPSLVRGCLTSFVCVICLTLSTLLVSDLDYHTHFVSESLTMIVCSVSTEQPINSSLYGVTLFSFRIMYDVQGWLVWNVIDREMIYFSSTKKCQWYIKVCIWAFFLNDACLGLPEVACLYFNPVSAHN